MADQLNHDVLTVRVLAGALGGAKAALTRETGYKALEAGEREAAGDAATAQLSTPGSVWYVTIQRVRSS